jgi:cytoskeleton protein RodZ
LPPEIGNTLREARTRQGIALSEVEEATKIRARFLRAMEEEQWDVLPGGAYARGFLATYARYLGLDEAELVAEYGRGARGAEAGPIPDEMLPKPGMTKAHAIRPGRVIATAVVLVAIALLIVGLPGGDGDEGGRGTGQAVSAEAEDATTATTTTTAEPARIPVELRATGSVWVCLVGKDGETLVDGETLAAGEERGPFKSRAFELTVGNGAIEITADGKPVEVPDAAEPLGYRITAKGASELAGSEQPACL